MHKSYNDYSRSALTFYLIKCEIASWRIAKESPLREKRWARHRWFKICVMLRLYLLNTQLVPVLGGHEWVWRVGRLTWHLKAWKGGQAVNMDSNAVLELDCRKQIIFMQRVSFFLFLTNNENKVCVQGSTGPLVRRVGQGAGAQL